MGLCSECSAQVSKECDRDEKRRKLYKKADKYERYGNSAEAERLREKARRL